MKPTGVMSALTRHSHWTAVGLAWTVMLTVSTGCALTGPTPPPPPGPRFPSGELTLGLASAVVPGEIVAASVGVTDTPCYLSWDPRAPCRWYKVVAPANGLLTAKLHADRIGGSMDLFALGYPDPAERAVDLSWRFPVPVLANQVVAFAVMAYDLPEPFRLQIDFQ